MAPPPTSTSIAQPHQPHHHHANITIVAQVEQDLAESYAQSALKLGIIPSHFVLPQQHSPSVALNNTGDEIPLIDTFGLSDSAHHSETMDAIHKACLEWGFFQVINHGVPQETMNRMKDCVEEFLSLLVSERAPCGVKKGVTGQGYRSGYVKPDTGARDWRDYFLLRTYPHSERDYKTWPTNTSFKEVIDEHCKELKGLSTKLMACLLENLGLPSPIYIEEALGELHQDLLINHYPPCPQPDLAVGANKHTDLGVLTCLWQTEDVVGLQVLKDGEWIPFKPLHGAYIINVVDQVEIVSNGIYKSVQYRAIVNSTKRRISIAVFYDLHPEAVVKPALELVTPDCPALYPPTRFANHARKLAIETYKIGDNPVA